MLFRGACYFREDRSSQANEEFRYVISFRTDTCFRFDRARQNLDQQFVALFHQFAPCFENRGFGLRPASKAAVLFAGGLKRFARLDSGASKVVVQDLGGLDRRTFINIKFIHATILVAALFSRPVEAPGSPVRQNHKRNAPVKCIFKSLTNSFFGSARLLDFGEDCRFRRR